MKWWAQVLRGGLPLLLTMKGNFDSWNAPLATIIQVEMGEGAGSVGVVVSAPGGGLGMWSLVKQAVVVRFPRHIASECTTRSLCWNCQEPGHTASNCPNEGICHTCGKTGHLARDCSAPPVPPGDLRLCNNCYKQGHIAADCTNDKACNNCRKTGHLARDCRNDPVCNLCNVSGHVARQCPKANVLGDRGGGPRSSGFRDIVCRNCQQLGHMSRDCAAPLMICRNCGGRGHMAFECPSGRFMDRFPRRY
ncbi:Zinc finger protein GIS2 [Vitis vinifera]|uniref:Zinc finger protein GIS2 n=1 Tax=Vitis vinifera TaxID=29760 RepID=A0A438DM46_VITVI|nr:Zinc finger protein GIS2 [Vitis vinifera]